MIRHLPITLLPMCYPQLLTTVIRPRSGNQWLASRSSLLHQAHNRFPLNPIICLHRLFQLQAAYAGAIPEIEATLVLLHVYLSHTPGPLPASGDRLGLAICRPWANQHIPVGRISIVLCQPEAITVAQQILHHTRKTKSTANKTESAKWIVKENAKGILTGIENEHMCYIRLHLTPDDHLIHPINPQKLVVTNHEATCSRL